MIFDAWVYSKGAPLIFAPGTADANNWYIDIQNGPSSDLLIFENTVRYMGSGNKAYVDVIYTNENPSMLK